jgi:hypothetical protein
MQCGDIVGMWRVRALANLRRGELVANYCVNALHSQGVFFLCVTVCFYTNATFAVLLRSNRVSLDGYAQVLERLQIEQGVLSL